MTSALSWVSSRSDVVSCLPVSFSHVTRRLPISPPRGGMLCVARTVVTIVEEGVCRAQSAQRHQFSLIRAFEAPCDISCLLVDQDWRSFALPMVVVLEAQARVDPDA